jgi:hypothetical protein
VAESLDADGVRTQTGQEQRDTEEMSEQDPLVHVPAPFHLAITGHIARVARSGGASSYTVPA